MEAKFKDVSIWTSLVFFGVVISLKFPDLDHDIIKIPLLIIHRSMLLHSCLLGALVYYWGGKSSYKYISDPISVGIFIGLGVHLSFDLFPEGWNGYALVYVPFFGRLTWAGEILQTIFSFTWLLVNIYAGFWLIGRMIGNSFLHWGEVIFFTLAAFFSASAGEDSFYGPLFVLVVCILLVKPSWLRRYLPPGLQKFIEEQPPRAEQKPTGGNSEG